MVRRLLGVAIGLWRRRVTRRELHALSDWTLRDIGVRRDEIDRLRL